MKNSISDDVNISIEKLKELVAGSDNIVFFGGAGVSTESGIPDFRSVDGLYNQKWKYPPETILSHSFFWANPEEYFRFHREKLVIEGVKPNITHLRLAELEKEGKLRAVITQNIDGLHQKAGSEKVFEIHGTTAKNYCMRCGRRYPADAIFESVEPIPHCSCGGIIRCDVTLYEEQLPEEAVENAIEAISSADMMIIGGTSLRVYPAASYVNLFEGKHLVVVNREHLNCRMRPGFDLEINAPIGEVFSRLK